jgi:Ca2+/H+ antiporter
MDTDQFLMELLKAVHTNTTAISELRRSLNIEAVSSDIKKVIGRLDAIDKWQKIKLPFIIGIITLVLYGVGFFFTLNRVADMIQSKHTAPITAPRMP